VPDRRAFQGFGDDRFRTAIGKSLHGRRRPPFSPHDLRHRRISPLLREEDPVTFQGSLVTPAHRCR
jgi:hypothetical protein